MPKGNIGWRLKDQFAHTIEVERRNRDLTQQDVLNEITPPITRKTLANILIGRTSKRTTILELLEGYRKALEEVEPLQAGLLTERWIGNALIPPVPAARTIKPQAALNGQPLPQGPLDTYVSRPGVQAPAEQALEAWPSREDQARATLVSIEGGGGAGKTRLAKWLISTFGARAPGGVFFADFSFEDPLETTENILVSRIAQAVGLSDAKTLEELVRGLGNRRSLLILDNLETVPQEALRGSLPGILTGCPGLAVICASRFALGLSYPSTLIDLSAGMTTGESIELLADRWVEWWPSNLDAPELDPESLAAIADICAGIPLALELVASSRTSPRVVAKELPILKDEILRHYLNPQAASEREASMEASLWWSYRHLQQRSGRSWPKVDLAFRACGTLAGSFAVADFIAIAGPPAGGQLRTLQAASLVNLDPLTGRWNQHAFARAFARERLDESADRSRLQAKFVERYWNLLIERSVKTLPEMLRSLSEDEHNWVAAGFALVRAFSTDPLAAEAFKSARARLQAYVWFSVWDPSALASAAATAFERLGDEMGQAHCLETLATAKIKCHEFVQADAFLGPARVLYKRLGDARGEANCLRCLASNACSLGCPREAIPMYREAYEIALGKDQSQAAFCLREMGGAEIRADGDLEQAAQWILASRPMFLELGQRQNAAICDCNIAEIHNKRGDLAEACQLLTQALTIFVESSDMESEMGCRVRLAHFSLDLFEQVGDRERIAVAEKQLSRFVQLHRNLPRPRGYRDLILLRGRISQARGQACAAKKMMSEALSMYEGIGDAEGIEKSRACLDRLESG